MTHGREMDELDMKLRAELAEEYLLGRFPSYKTDQSVMHVDVEVFLAGWDACEERVMELLRSDYARQVFQNNSYGVACNLLESKLKGGGE